MMPSVLQMFTRKREERRQYGPNMGLPNQTPLPRQPPPSAGLTTQRQPSEPQLRGTYPNWGNGPAQPSVVPPDTQDDEHVAWFTAIDQDNSGQVSTEELQSALINGYGRKRFSSETVKYLMSIFDLDGSGEIGIDEFKPLWIYVKVRSRSRQFFTFNPSVTAMARDVRII